MITHLISNDFSKDEAHPRKHYQNSPAVLLLLCLFHMPYGYYQIFKVIAMVGFAILAYYEYKRKNIPMAIVFVGLMLLFQPIARVALGRQVWNIVDIIAAVALIVSLVVQR